MTCQADERLEKHQPAFRSQDTPRFLQKRIGRFQMMKNIEQNQVTQTFRDEGKLITIANQIEPRIKKQVGGNGLGNVIFQVSDAGADFNNTAWNGAVYA